MRQAFRYYAEPAVIVSPQRTQIIIPAFILSVPTWIGGSSLLAEFPIENTENFSFQLPIGVFGENFIAAIRWQSAIGVWARYILFEHDDAVLAYPLYAGEKIGENAVLEIWSVDSVLNPELEDAFTLFSSILVFPPGYITNFCNYCCDNGSSIINLVMTDPTELPPGAECNPFCSTLCSTPTPMPTCECENKVVNNVQDGRDYEPEAFISPSLLFTLGGLAPGDGFGKAYRWDSASLAVDTGDEMTTVIRPTTISPSAPGRWLQYI